SATASNTQIKNGENVTITVPVTNAGKKSGTEIVQVYVRKLSNASDLTKTLRGFQRINVNAGKTSNAIINLPYNAFEFYDDKALQVKVTSGEYEIFYGNSSDAKDLKMIKINVL